MTDGDDRTAGAMGDDERRDYVRQDGAAMAAPPDGPSRDLRERLIRALYVATWDETFEDWSDASEIEIAFTGSQVDAVLAEIAAAGYVIVKADRFERLRAYVVADQEFSQASTWAGIWQDDGVQRKAVELQYAGREERRRAAHHAITLGDLDPGEPEAGR